jgi:hypothetical protein
MSKNIDVALLGLLEEVSLFLPGGAGIIEGATPALKKFSGLALLGDGGDGP